MKKISLILGAVLLIEATCVLNVHAVRAAHRPWLARGNASVERIENDRKPLTTRQVVRSMRTEGEKIAQQARRYAGTKYRFGGDSKSKGFDCSGLISRVYHDLRLSKVPRTSSGLYKMGKPVRTTDLRPGDLVFFKNTYKRGISHVGVYAGQNRFVHAMNRRTGVTLTALSEPYYQLHYAGARRLY